jgi:hypothetical protein
MTTTISSDSFFYNTIMGICSNDTYPGIRNEAIICVTRTHTAFLSICGEERQIILSSSKQSFWCGSKKKKKKGKVHPRKGQRDPKGEQRYSSIFL